VRLGGLERITLRWNQSKKSTSISPALFFGLHHFAKTYLSFLHTWVTLELEVILVERDMVAKEELRGAFENVQDCVLGEVEGSIHEGEVSGEVGEDGEQCRERRVDGDSCRNIIILVIMGTVSCYRVSVTFRVADSFPYI
jgi:hypothetical protein